MTEQTNDTAIRFDIFTRAWDPDKNEFVPDAIKAEVGPDNRMRLRGIASSSVRDLHGDIITESALLDMERAANQNLTIFGNHSYDVPEDVYGSAEKALLRRNAGVDDKGEPFHLLDLDIGINEENDRAVKTWKAIRKGTKLGLSIGAMIPPGGAKIDKKTGTLIIEHVELLETSIVGIPANPKSWVENAVKSFKEGPKPLMLAGVLGQTATISNTNFDATKWSFDLEDDAHEDLDIANAEVVDETGEADEPDLTEAAMCPTCGKGHDAEGCSDSYHKDVEPDLEKVRVRVTVDTDEKTPAAPPSEPTPSGSDVTNSASETVAEAQEAVVGMDAEVTNAFTRMASLISQLTEEVVAAKTAERDALAAKAAAEQQRDAIVVSAGEAIANTKTIIQRLADIPLGPRAAVVRDAESDLSNLEGIYSRDFLELLRSK